MCPMMGCVIIGTRANIKGDGEKIGMEVLYNYNRAWLIHVRKKLAHSFEGITRE